MFNRILQFEGMFDTGVGIFNCSIITYVIYYQVQPIRDKHGKGKKGRTVKRGKQQIATSTKVTQTVEAILIDAPRFRFDSI